jgi:hypothetical protein
MDERNDDLKRLLEAYEPDFKPFFETRLKAKMFKIKKDQDYSGMYDRFFKRVVYSGFAAVAAILLVIFISNGSLGIDALMGVKDLSLEQSLALSLAGL